MSHITPASFVDDGGSFPKRVPHGLHPKHIATWINTTGSDTSAYTGSFIDDGADLLIPSQERSGFGQVDTRFYKQRKRKEETAGAWNDDIQRAISGDIHRNLAKVKDIAKLERKKKGRDDDDAKRGKSKRTVTVPVPPKWGTFIIKTEDRVIIVGPDGEFDSGPQIPRKDHKGTRWIEAASTMETLSPMDVYTPTSPSRHHSSSYRLKERSEKQGMQHKSANKDTKRNHKHPSSPHLKSLQPIPESEYENYQLSVVEDVISPTGFFMTGGANGWPSKAATSVASLFSSPSKQHHSSPTSLDKQRSKSTSKSATHSSPDSWQLPPGPPLKLHSTSGSTWDDKDNDDPWKDDGSHHSHRSGKTHRSRKSGKSHRSHKADFDNVSTKTYSTYKVPTVEDAPTTASGSVANLDATGWGGSAKSNSVKERSGSVNGSAKNKRTSSKGGQSGWVEKHAGEVDNWTASQKGSENSWTESKKSAAAGDEDWSGDDVTSEKERVSGGPHAAREPSWDGFERIKTISEVSVAGSDSGSSNEQGSRNSHASSRYHSAHQSRTSRRSHKSRGSSNHTGQKGWEGSPASEASQQSWGSQKARVDDDGWEGNAMESETGRVGRRRGSERIWNGSGASTKDRGERYANGYDEDNQTYLNANWAGTPVRVGSRRTSVAGWT